jgi:hypothetical protein
MGSKIRNPKSRKVQIQNQLSSGAFQFAISVGVCFGFAFDGFLVVSCHAEPFGDLRVNSRKHLLCFFRFIRRGEADYRPPAAQNGRRGVIYLRLRFEIPHQFIEHVGFIDEALDAGQARRSLDVRV